MRVVAAGFAGFSVFLLATRVPVASLADRVAGYLVAARRPSASAPRERHAPLRTAGLDWSQAEVAARRVASGVTGAIVGLLVAQGDVFVAGSNRSVPALGILGAASGLLGFRIWLTQRTRWRSHQLAAELPVVVDLIALRVLAGESVASALEHVTEGTSGVASEEFAAVLDGYSRGRGLPEALQAAVRETVTPEAGRLYVFLANAHQSGGRLAEALLALSSDYRAEEERALQVEGGRRALAIYAPILALMVPVALLFLMYPTLAGLSELSAIP